MASIQLKNVVKRFNDTTIIKGVSLDIADNEFVVFVGPSGCGKSTLLRLIAGLEDITEGDLLIDGERINSLPPAKRGIAMVFQSYALYPHMTNYDNIAFALRQSNTDKATIDAKVRKVADILQISHLLDRKPKELSGGQRQRVAIGRAIVRDPKVFLFDEPLSNLDASLRVQMRLEIAKLKADLQTTMIYVTHDQVEAMTLADKIVILRAGEVEQVGTPLELYHHPRNQFVAGFIGSPNMNFIDVNVANNDGQQITLALDNNQTAKLAIGAQAGSLSGKATLGIRPEHILTVDSNTSSNDNFAAVIDGKVFVVEKLGGESYLYLKLGNGENLVVRRDGSCRYKQGDTLRLAMPMANCHLFDANGLAITLKAS
jgi:multiple sugar transport system ATP-binding protein